MEGRAKRRQEGFWSADILSAGREHPARQCNERTGRDAGDPHAGCVRSIGVRSIGLRSGVRSYFASSPFSFMISSVISAAAYMSFTSSHSLTV